MPKNLIQAVNMVMKKFVLKVERAFQNHFILVFDSNLVNLHLLRFKRLKLLLFYLIVLCKGWKLDPDWTRDSN